MNWFYGMQFCFEVEILFKTFNFSLFSTHSNTTTEPKLTDRITKYFTKRQLLRAVSPDCPAKCWPLECAMNGGPLNRTPAVLLWRMPQRWEQFHSYVCGISAFTNTTSEPNSAKRCFVCRESLSPKQNNEICILTRDQKSRAHRRTISEGNTRRNI